jgi:hypothetical protein
LHAAQERCRQALRRRPLQTAHGGIQHASQDVRVVGGLATRDHCQPKVLII